MRGDKRGPEGKGPRTGRAMGFCTGHDHPGFVNSGYFSRGEGEIGNPTASAEGNSEAPDSRDYGRGMGYGRSRGGFGRGRGAGFGGGCRRRGSRGGQW